MSLRSKLLLAQLPLALALILVGVASRQTITRLDASSQDILKDNYLSVLAAQRMGEAARDLDRAALAHALGGSAPADPLPGRRAAFDHELAFQEHNITEAGERERTERLRSAWTRFQAGFDRLIAAGADRSLAVQQGELEPAHLELEKALAAITAVNEEAMVRKSEIARSSGERMNVLMTALTLAACLLGLVASVYFTTRAMRPLAALGRAVRRLAEGDLTARAALHGGDEIARLGGEFDEMATRLAEYRSSTLGELLQAQQASQAAIDSLPDPVLVVHAGRLLNANRAAEALFGISAEQDGEAAFAGAPPEVRMLVAKIKEHVASGGGAWVPRGLDEAIAIPMGEGPRHFLARANPVLGPKGQVIGLTILFQDVSRLRRFDELRNDLVATVAHEFRTPLTSMRMAIDLCVEGGVGPLTDKQSELLSAARGDCQRLQTFVDELLDLSRIQAGRIELHARPLSSAALIGHAVDAHRAAAGEKTIALGVAGKSLDAQVLADPDRIQLVLTNLIQNAIRHTPAGGHVEVRAAPQERALRFEVSDTGAGIPKEHLQRLFERFSRVPGTPGAGAGLGLYICKEIVEAHGGSIGVESDPGRGSIFWFTVPTAQTS